MSPRAGIIWSRDEAPNVHREIRHRAEAAPQSVAHEKATTPTIRASPAANARGETPPPATAPGPPPKKDASEVSACDSIDGSSVTFGSLAIGSRYPDTQFQHWPG